MKKEYLKVEIAAKRATERDVVSQEMVERCIGIALKAHHGQRDLDGNAVVLHPLMVGSMGLTNEEKCVGFLHDVVEDTAWTLEDLREAGVPEVVLEAVDLCTHHEGVDYLDYVQRIIDSGNTTAIHVKLNDLHHNLARGKAYGYTDLVAKHTVALRMIEQALKKRE